MNKIIKNLVVFLILALCACCIFACSGGQGLQGLPPTIDGAVDQGYMPPYTSAYGAQPDLEGVIIDGALDDQLWTASSMRWYTHYEANPRIRYEMACSLSSGGLYVAFRSYDPIVAWHGYNCFYRNTNVQLHLYAEDYGGSNVVIQLDANNVRPSGYFINARSQYYGQLNFAGKGEGISCEVYVQWEDLGISTSESVPELMAILPVYNYCISTVANTTTTMLPTFVKTTGNRSQAIEFDKNGYVDCDGEGQTVGSHESGLAKTNGWTIEGEGNSQSATSSINKTSGFPQVAFFRESTASIFKATTTIELGKGSRDARAGIILYKDSINYRAVALSYDGTNHQSGEYLYDYDLKGYTNYPANITHSANLYSQPSEYGYDRVELTVYNNNGKLYYLLDGEFIGSEAASYVSTNNYIGLYAFDVTAKFTRFKCVEFDTEQELLDDFSRYAYMVDVINQNVGGLIATTNQLAVPKQGGSVDVTLSFTQGYTLKEVSYSVNGGQPQSAEQFAQSAVRGVFTMPIDGNTVIMTDAERIDESLLIPVQIDCVDKETGDKIMGTTATLIGGGAYTRFDVRISGYTGEVMLPAGYSWEYVATSAGYCQTSGELYGGAVIDDRQDLPAKMLIKSLTVGGTALPPTDENGANLIDFTKASVVGSVYDVSKGEEGLIVFQTSKIDTGEIYFSGRTISDYQVAYVEITNRTDPSAFTSLENDPAAGFLIASTKATTFVGARLDGLRIIPDRQVFSQRSDINGLVSWSGHLATTDRDNGGRFLNSYEGNGTVNRIPNGGVEYTTSLMLVRKGGYTYVYACDGKAGVRPDKANLSKMKLIYSFYNNYTDGYAAIGFGTTCYYNLRMDFENYWILCADKASAFIGEQIERQFTMGGDSSLVSVGGSGLVEYDTAANSGRCIASSPITLTATQVSEGKMLRLRLSTGETYYLIEQGDSVTYTQNGSNLKFNIEVSEVDYQTVSGKVLAPSGMQDRVYYGQMLDQSGNVIMDVQTTSDGSFSYKIEKGAEVRLCFKLEGYAMQPTVVGASDVTLTFTKVPMAYEVSRLDSVKASSTDKATYGYSIEDGAYFQVKYACEGSDYVYLSTDSLYDSMIIDMKYQRYAAPTGYNGKVDADFSFGATFYGETGSYGMRFIGDGYRVLMDDSYGSSYQKTERGFGGADFSQLKTVQPYDVRFIKLGSVVYMLNKYQSQSEYTLVHVMDLMPHVGSSLTDVAITWTSLGWAHIKVSNITVTQITDDTFSDIMKNVKAVELTLEGDKEYAVVTGAGVLEENAEQGTARLAPGAQYSVVAMNLPENNMLRVEEGASSTIIDSGDAVTLIAPKSGRVNVTLTLVEGFLISGSAAIPKGVAKLNGSVRDSEGKLVREFTTQSNGKFSVFVSSDRQYYLHFYCDGYVSDAVKIEQGGTFEAIELEKIDLVGGITRRDGVFDPAPSYDVPVYKKANGSLAFDVKADFAGIDGLYIRPEKISENMEISYTLERRAKPDSVAATEDKDASMGLVICGDKGLYGARFIANGYRIMQKDSYNAATNVENRSGSPINMSLLSYPQPYNLKFVKTGAILKMYAKLSSESEYTLVYTHNLTEGAYSIGGELADIAISWCYWGYADITVSDIVIKNLD